MATYQDLQAQFLLAKANGDNNTVSKLQNQASSDVNVMKEAETAYKSANGITPTQAKIDPFQQYQNYANQLKEAQKQAQLANLTKARDSSISNLNAERGQIQPLYYNARSKESTGSQLQAKNFAEYMAQRGQSNSGASGQAELARNVSLQGNIGALNQQEANAFTENSRRMTDVNNAFNNDVVSANAGIEAQSLQNLLNAYQQNQVMQQEQSNLDRSFNYQVGRDNVSDTRYTNEWEFNQAQTKLDNEFKLKQAEIDNLYRQGQMSLQERQMKLSEAEFKFQQEQAKIDNAYRAQTKSSGSSSSGSTLNKAQAKNDLFMEMDSYIKGGEYERAKEIIEQDKAAIIANFGQTTYNQLYNMFWDSQAY